MIEKFYSIYGWHPNRYYEFASEDIFLPITPENNGMEEVLSIS